jgi:hypothetical protein
LMLVVLVFSMGLLRQFWMLARFSKNVDHFDHSNTNSVLLKNGAAPFL